MIDSPVVIAGSGRSGSTWVLDSIAEANSFRTIFEPLHPIHNPYAKMFHEKYVKDDAHEPELRLLMDKVFSGSIKSLWSNYRIESDWFHLSSLFNSGSLKQKIGPVINNYKKIVNGYLKYQRQKKYDEIIVKFIRANLMLGWLSNNYDINILLVLRHPGGVVASKKKLVGPGWKHELLLRQYLEDKHLMEDFPEIGEVLARPLSYVEAQTVIWCIQNLIPIKNAEKNNIYISFYEHLLDDPASEYDRIIKEFNIDRLPDMNTIGKPSQQVSKEMKNSSFTKLQISKWMKSFGESQLREMDSILKYFKVDFYSAFDPVPQRRL